MFQFELENARHEMMLCFDQIKSLESWAQQINEGGCLNKILL
jgi:hypothetical protein